jgi:serine protease inhibitor
MATQGIKQRFGALLLAGVLTGLTAQAGAGEYPAPAALGSVEGLPLEMTHRTGSYPYFQGELKGAAFQALKVPYGTGRSSVLIVLPDSSANFGRFVASITTQELNRWTAQLRFSFGSVSFPKLAPVEGLPASTPLASLDIDGAAAPASGALAAMNAQFERAGARPFTMNVNRPFFYAIQDNKTNEFLFVGVLMNPS